MKWPRQPVENSLANSLNVISVRFARLDVADGGYLRCLLRIAAQLLLQPVHSIFECPQFRLLGSRLILGFHFCALPLSLFSREAFEF
jgi:hypothetical protein